MTVLAHELPRIPAAVISKSAEHARNRWRSTQGTVEQRESGLAWLVDSGVDEVTFLETHRPPGR